MYRVNLYLMKLCTRYILVNLIIISFLIVFFNIIELSRVLDSEDKNFFTFLNLSALKYPSILNEILPFVIIISISFLFRNLINNNELISLRNIGFSIFDIFIPIGITVFIFGLFFLFFLNPISSNFDKKYQEIIDNKDTGLYAIKILDKRMWIKNSIDQKNYSFISIKNINLQNMIAEDIKILNIDLDSKILIHAQKGEFSKNTFYLNNVRYYDVNKEKFDFLDTFKLEINFNKNNLLNSITNFKLIPFYNYWNHTETLKKFNLYSAEIGLFYISEILKPLFIVMLSFVIVGFSGKFKRNENFFKILFFSIFIGFIIFFLKEVITKMTISLSINFYISYLIIFFLPLSIGFYQIINIEND